MVDEQFSTLEQPEKNTMPLGASGTEIYGGTFSEEYLQKLQSTHGMKEYDKMRRSEPQIVMLLSAVKNPIKSADWTVYPANETPEAKLQAELVDDILKRQLNWEKFLNESLSILDFGHVVFEIVHKVVLGSKKYGDFNGIAQLGFRSQKTIDSWNLDKMTGQILSIKQQIDGDVGKSSTIPGQFLLVMTLNQEGDNYEGISSLRPLYGPYIRKNLYQRLNAIGIEKYAVGTPIGTMPEGKDTTSPDYAEFKKVLRSYTSHETAFVIVPSGYKIEINRGDFDASKIKDVILLENSEMVNAFVANFLALGMNGSGGSFSLGTDLSDFFLSGIQQYANIITGALNRSLIPEIIKMNFGEQENYPYIKCTGINDKAGKELAEIVTALAGGPTIKADDKLEDFLRKAFDLPVVDKTTAKAIQSNDQIASAVPQEDVQKLALNGAQVGSLLDIVQRVSLGLLPRDSGVQAIMTAFNTTIEQANAIMANAGQGFVVNKDSLAQVTLAEPKSGKEWKADFKTHKEMLYNIMQQNLSGIYSDIKNQIRKNYDSASENDKVKAASKVEPKGVTAYQAALKEALAQIAFENIEDAKKEVPKKLKLSERFMLAAPRGGYYAALPAHVRKILDAQSLLISGTQVADIEKVTYFQFTSSSLSTPNIDQIIKDIDDKVLPSIQGASNQALSLDVAATNATSLISNQARLDFFFEPEVLDTIESFTFTNEDPVSEICQALDGQTFAVGDPDLDRYLPPLHHKCKSRLVPNLKGDKNPEVTGLGSLSDKAIKSISLHECCPTSFKLFTIDEANKAT